MLFIAGGQSHNVLRETGDFVHLLFDGNAGLQVVELHRAGGLRQNREGKGIPLGENLAVSDVFAVLNAEARAVDNVVALLLTALLIDDGDEAGTVHGDERAATTLDVFKVDEFDHPVVAGFERGALGDARGGSADVERAHGELRAGFADGLCGDDADGFAELDHAAGGQVAAIAQRAHAAPRFASEHGTDAHAVDTGALDGVGELFVDFLVHVDDDVALEVFDFVQGNAAHDAVTERLDFHAPFDNGLDVNAVRGAAVVFVDDYILRDVDEAAREVAGVSGLQRRVSEAFARAVRDGAVQILLLNLDAFLFRGVHELVLVARDEHVVDANGDPRPRGVGEAQRLEVVEQNNRVGQAKAQVGVIDQLLNALFLLKP